MDSARSTPVYIAAILNAAYLVRMYCRPFQRAQRAAAIRHLGLECRRAFNEDGLHPRDERTF